MKLVNIYRNGKEYHIEAEKAQEYCDKYGFSLSLPVKRKRGRKKKNVNNDNGFKENQIGL